MRYFSAIRVAALLAALPAGYALSDEPPANWPRWRGPDGSGVAAGANLPAEWSSTKNILWKTPIPGRGHSSPVVWGNRIFLTTSLEGPVVPGAKAPVHILKGEEYRHPDSEGAERSYALRVMALNADTGAILWAQTAYRGRVYDNRHRKNTYASPTAATDGERVYFYFGSAGLYAYNFAGEPVWKADLGNIGTVGYGVGTSPVLWENLVIVQRDSELGEDSYLVAFDKKTGKEIWRAPRKVQVSWATPVLVTAGERTLLAASGSERIIFYDPATGREVWSTEGVVHSAIASPVAGNGMVYFFTGYPEKRVIAIRLEGRGRDARPEVAWRYDRGTAYVASPVLYGGYLYLTSDSGILTCLEARTGKVIYDNGRLPAPATFFASLLAYEGMIFQFSEEGDAFVVRAGPKHEVLRTNALGEAIYATPAAVAGRLYLRTEKHLYAIGAESKGETRNSTLETRCELGRCVSGRRRAGRRWSR